MKVFRNTSHEKIPAHAKRIVKLDANGIEQVFASFVQRSTNRRVEFLVLPNGKMKAESTTYYCRIKKHGATRKAVVNTGESDKREAERVAKQMQKQEGLGQSETPKNETDSLKPKPLIGCPKPLPKRKHTRSNGEIVIYSSIKSYGDLKERISGSYLGCYHDYLVNHEDKPTQRHIMERVRKIRDICIACEFKSLSDIAPTKVGTGPSRNPAKSRLETYLAGLKAKGLADRTRNEHLVSIKCLINWLVREGIMPRSPFTEVKRKTGKKYRETRPRRALSPQEVLGLRRAARGSTSMFQGISGHQRALIYAFAYRTGVRRREAAQLRVADVMLDPESPQLILRPEITKAGERAVLPIHAKLVGTLRRWIAGRSPDGLLFDLMTPSGNPRDIVRAMRRDLDAASIAYQTEFGVARLSFTSFVICNESDS